MSRGSLVGHRSPSLTAAEATRHSHRGGVDRALVTAALFWAAVAPSIQFLLVEANSRAHDRLPVVALAFGVHAAVWVLVLLRRVPPRGLLVTWTLLGVAVAGQATDGAIEMLRAALNIGISASILAGLLLGLRGAVTGSLAMSLTIAVYLGAAVPELTSSTWSYLVLLPLNSVASACAAGVLVRELRAVAGVADQRALSRFTADRTLARKMLEAEAGRRRSRLLHDTVVNTLGAIATGRVVSDDAVVAQRCADDVRAVDELRARRGAAWSSIDDIFVHARAMGVEVRVGNLDGLRNVLAAQPAWQRRGILSTIREAVTTVAKHAQVTETRVEFSAETRLVTVTDTGKGMSDVGAVQSAMSIRAEDAGVQATVSSLPGQGTVTTIELPAPRPVTRSGVFERASARMATGISAVMLAQFAGVIVVTTTFRTGWSSVAIAPALIVWLIVASALIVMLRHAGTAAGLPAGAVVGTYLALAGGMVVYGMSRPEESACGVHPNLGWAGDAAAAICAVLVLLDGRVRVVAPALAIITLGSFVVLAQDAGRCGGSTVGLLVADALAVAAFVILRRQVRKLSDAAATQIDDEVRRREQQDRLAAETAIRSAGFDRLMDEARELLHRVSLYPPSIREPDVRVGAALEESYLRALIGLPYESGAITEAFVQIIDAAKRARVRIEINLEEAVLDDATAGCVSMIAVGIIGSCRPDDAVSLGVFRSAGRGEMILVAPAHALAAGRTVLTASLENAMADVTLAESDGLVEVRW